MKDLAIFLHGHQSEAFDWSKRTKCSHLCSTTGYLYWLSTLIVNSMNLETYASGKRDLLKTVTKPLTKLVISVSWLPFASLLRIRFRLLMSLMISAHWLAEENFNSCSMFREQGGAYDRLAVLCVNCFLYRLMTLDTLDASSLTSSLQAFLSPRSPQLWNRSRARTPKSLQRSRFRLGIHGLPRSRGIIH